MTELLLSLPIELPRLLFATQNSMDDYCAPDMLYGDLSAEVLRKQYHLDDISTHLDPYTYPDREQSARILFDEFRDLSDMFSFWGDYKSLTRAMISHMQYGNGAAFSNPLLDQAMAEHSSVQSSLKAILSALKKYIDWERQVLPGSVIHGLSDAIMESALPQFDNFADKFNELGITVHDIWATHITLESINIENNKFTAELKYHFQDHFGLDTRDITNTFYHQFRIFRIWFCLQHLNNYAYRPFITDMTITKKVSLGRYEKI